ncbi:bifunctional phosphopantothenoylcysteine decarboxylase/phosphopantothenate--cysteine ligase CoaBC [Candidatus Haliotispira prima]|uniref:Coenzyme A biosynthesis bifunctional protein CoaBC n=1 Tax=Candidatus Haliotispira prima TaxID=3034016 RepID=A0ABY8MHP9_9SPIO|nr:bifunctional phosphopantothenoylcysteine decarboxylase/phosphopantothenate--cysteine ligase CoaBC [Candidatus Haliotispira prima]
MNTADKEVSGASDCMAEYDAHGRDRYGQSKGNILLGICGGIAAYKIPGLVSLLAQQGYRVRVVLSEAGARFASREALEVLSGRQVYSDLWERYQEQGSAGPAGPGPVGSEDDESPESSPVLHIALVDEADIFLVAPASYNWVGKAGSGLADDLLSTLFAAWPLKGERKKPLLFAPAMNPEMWCKDVLQENISRLEEQGCQLIEPDSGFLACRAEGRGRMVEAEELYCRLESHLRFRAKNHLLLQGKKILLTAGPTREALDPVRYISNRSSGGNGIALACAARDLGAEVILISGIEETKTRLGGGFSLSQQLFGIRVLNCNSALEMARHAADHFADCDWAVAVAAVCDFRPARVEGEKMKKEPGRESYHLEFRLNPDILAWWGEHKEPGRQKVLGFALENAGGPDAAEREQGYALGKLRDKNADAIVLNRLGNLEGNCAEAQLFFAETPEQGRILGPQDKRDFAAELLLLLCERWL